MAGYVAMARVSGAQVRALAWDGRAPWDRDCADDGVVAEHAATIEDPWIDELAERIARARETLAIMTFYLTDAESWR